MPNPMTGAGYGKNNKNDKKDAENYTKPTIDREKYYDELTNDPRITRGQMTPDQYKSFINDKRKLTAGMKPISRALADLNAAGGAGASGPGAAYTKSLIKKGEKASKEMQSKSSVKNEKAAKIAKARAGTKGRPKDVTEMSRAGTKGRKKVRLGNVETFKGSLYEKRQQAFLKKMKDMNEKSMKPKYNESQLPPRKN